MPAIRCCSSFADSFHSRYTNIAFWATLLPRSATNAKATWCQGSRRHTTTFTRVVFKHNHCPFVIFTKQQSSFHRMMFVHAPIACVFKNKNKMLAFMPLSVLKGNTSNYSIRLWVAERPITSTAYPMPRKPHLRYLIHTLILLKIYLSYRNVHFRYRNQYNESRSPYLIYPYIGLQLKHHETFGLEIRCWNIIHVLSRYIRCKFVYLRYAFWDLMCTILIPKAWIRTRYSGCVWTPNNDQQRSHNTRNISKCYFAWEGMFLYAFAENYWSHNLRECGVPGSGPGVAI